MSLYEYDLSQYVIETSLDVPTDGADGVIAFRIRMVGDAWGEESDSYEPHGTSGGYLVVWLYPIPPVKSQLLRAS
jgi:hypothetical protein